MKRFTHTGVFSWSGQVQIADIVGTTSVLSLLCEVGPLLCAPRGFKLLRTHFCSGFCLEMSVNLNKTKSAVHVGQSAKPCDPVAAAKNQGQKS